MFWADDLHLWAVALISQPVEGNDPAEAWNNFSNAGKIKPNKRSVLCVKGSCFSKHCRKMKPLLLLIPALLIILIAASYA